MKITEYRLRSIIRNIINETPDNWKPDSWEKIKADHEAWNASLEDQRNHKEYMTSIESATSSQQQIADLVEILRTKETNEEIIQSISNLNNLPKSDELLSVIARLAIEQGKQSEVVSGGITHRR